MNGFNILIGETPALSRIINSLSKLILLIVKIVAANAAIGRTIAMTCGKKRNINSRKTIVDCPSPIRSLNIPRDRLIQYASIRIILKNPKACVSLPST